MNTEYNCLATLRSETFEFRNKGNYANIHFTMDALLPQLLSFPPHPEPTKPLSDSEYDKMIKNLVHHINSVSTSKLISAVPGGGDLLDVRRRFINYNSLSETLTDITPIYRSLIPRRIRFPTSTHYSLTSVAPLVSKRLVQKQMRSRQGPSYGRRCWNLWNASMGVRSDTQAPSFCGS